MSEHYESDGIINTILFYHHYGSHVSVNCKELISEDLININIEALLCVFKEDSKEIQRLP